MSINRTENGNCFDLLSVIEPASVDLIFSDSPYVTALNDLNDWNDVLDWNRLAVEFDRVLKPSAFMK